MFISFCPRVAKKCKNSNAYSDSVELMSSYDDLDLTRLRLYALI